MLTWDSPPDFCECQNLTLGGELWATKMGLKTSPPTLSRWTLPNPLFGDDLQLTLQTGEYDYEYELVFQLVGFGDLFVLGRFLQK